MIDILTYFAIYWVSAFLGTLALLTVFEPPAPKYRGPRILHD